MIRNVPRAWQQLRGGEWGAPLSDGGRSHEPLCKSGRGHEQGGSYEGGRSRESASSLRRESRRGGSPLPAVASWRTILFHDVAESEQALGLIEIQYEREKSTFLLVWQVLEKKS